MASIQRVKATIVILIGVLLLFGASPVLADDNECVNCHTNPDRLKQLVGSANKAFATPVPNRMSRGGSGETLARWEKVYIDPEFLEDENHGELGCQECHGGDPTATDFDIVHKGVDYQPSYPEPSVCAECHEQTVNFTNSLHYNLAGFKAPIDARMGDDPEVRGKVDRAFSANCMRCHASCGSCHVGRPVHIGGGLKAGHAFITPPEMEETCGTCHGTTVTEFKGKIEGLEQDVHSEMDMGCLDCHEVEQMHGEEGVKPANRYESGPDCLECHEDIYDDEAENKQAHSAHRDKVSCQVCHSQAYTNCAKCHLTEDWDSKEKYQEWTAFKIGLNPNPTESHPEKAVTVRHVPVHKDMFAPFVDDAMPNFSAVPTYKMATPHNIRRQTPQNKDCNSCHGIANKGLYLMRPDVEKDTRKANRDVIIAPGRIPAPIADAPAE